MSLWVLLLATAWGQALVTVTPSAPVVRVGKSVQFAATVTGLAVKSVRWSVGLPVGGKGLPGTISESGLYTPPAVLPVPSTVLVTATSTAMNVANTRVIVSLQNPYPVVASTLPVWVPAGSSTLTVNGSGFVPAAQVFLDGIGVATTFVSATRLTAKVAATVPQLGQQLAVTVTNPAPGGTSSTGVVTVRVGPDTGLARVTTGAARRFLQQAAFGPDTVSMLRVQHLGFSEYLTEQFGTASSPFPDAATLDVSVAPVQARFYTNAVHGKDQVRQRMALALVEIFGGIPAGARSPAQLVPLLRVFQQGACGNFRQLLYNVTVNAAMGEAWDVRNNNKASADGATVPNENYARELLETFTVGPVLLNPDGSVKVNEDGEAVAAYSEKTVRDFAKVLTGWTYATRQGSIPARHNPANYDRALAPFEANHDTSEKVLLNGVKLRAGQTAQQDLSGALDIVFAHPNLAPFLAHRLIAQLVTDSPSRAYVARVASAFTKSGTGTGVRGDLKAVLRAVLLDQEARAGDAAGNWPIAGRETHGHWRAPNVMVPSILRGLEAQVNDTNRLADLVAAMGPGPSVPGDPAPPLWAGPEQAVGRFNGIYALLYDDLGAGVAIDLGPFVNVAGDGRRLAVLIDDIYFQGWMPAELQTELEAVAGGMAGTTLAEKKARAQAALYVALSSGLYNVQH